MNTIHFAKMHGLGNDFVVVNNLNGSAQLSGARIEALANRHLGIGFDQLLVIEKSSKADFFCRIFNADGNEAEQCGNGLRCVARFVRDNKLVTDTNFSIETKAGIFPVEFLQDNNIKVSLGMPILEEKLLPLELNNAMTVSATILSLGNPHAIIKVDETKTIPAALASDIAQTTYFPHGVNIGFMEVITPHHVKLRTFERGVGETHACGSNACAAAVAGILNGWLDHRVRVEYLYGSLTIDWDKSADAVYITGPATMVFQGEITI